MKRNHAILAIALVLVLILSVAGCSSKKADASIVGVWEFLDDGMTFTYDLKDDGTGTYTMNVGEEDVFDNEFSFQDENTLLIKDSFGEEMTFVRK